VAWAFSIQLPPGILACGSGVQFIPTISSNPLDVQRFMKLLTVISITPFQLQAGLRKLPVLTSVSQAELKRVGVVGLLWYATTRPMHGGVVIDDANGTAELPSDFG
jgi:hypothetical protein